MENVFSTAEFIKADIAFDPSVRNQNHAPMFRKRFLAKQAKKAVLSICGLGYAYCYMNGKPVSEDLFCAPPSDYNKTLWYLDYDVTSLLSDGENTLAVICGNGWLNEEFDTPWGTNTAAWRDHPKLILQLTVDGTPVVVSDESWLCKPESAIVYNALRSGEHFDSRLYDENWIAASYDDSLWEPAVVDRTPPKGRFRRCTCEPIREFEVYEPRQVRKLAPGKYLFDMGQNLSGYIRLTAKGTWGKTYRIRYIEMCHEDGTPADEGLERFYPESAFQTDVFVCSGRELTWSPKFAYHGFRYIEISGIDAPDELRVQSVFVHQAIRPRTEFSCSDSVLTELFRAGRVSCYSNMFYLLSDCPTREKLGWMNDAQMSCDQLLTDFEIEHLLEKWLTDIYDAMREDGALPGIVPTTGWGYQWGNGPLSDGMLFELPYRVWRHTGNRALLINSLPYFTRYLEYLKTREDENGWVTFGLGDWASAGDRNDIPVAFVNAVLIQKFYGIAAKAANFTGNYRLQASYETQSLRWRKKLLQSYLCEDGRCKLGKQAAVAMLICHGLYDEINPLKEQLQKLLMEKDYHHDCGILGLRCMFEALNKCGLQECAYRILRSEGIPGFRNWLEMGATSLWEWWAMYPPSGEYNSRNHHMHSHFMSWLIQTVLGIRHDKTEEGVPELRVEPYFFGQLEWARGSYRTDSGILTVQWERKNRQIELRLTLTDGCAAIYKDTVLSAGEHLFIISGEIPN